ncbi:MAG: hypothetical protein U0457_11960 [Candidatus Sericytochromatia bacterium]
MLKRILQDYKGEIIELNNKKVEKFFCVQTKDDQTGILSPCLFWLKTYEQKHWHRFFVDEIMCAWDIYEKLNEDDFNNEEDYPFFDVCQKYELNNLEINSIIIEEVFLESKYYNRLTIEFIKNIKVLIESDMDGKKIIRIQK